jgi:hypothetical protein
VLSISCIVSQKTSKDFILTLANIHHFSMFIDVIHIFLEVYPYITFVSSAHLPCITAGICNLGPTSHILLADPNVLACNSVKVVNSNFYPKSGFQF